MSRLVQLELPLIFLSDDSRPPLLINLGIDFGTMFTKVCFRDLGMEESQIITFGGNATDDAMVPSVVRIEADGKLSLARGCLCVGFLLLTTQLIFNLQIP